MRCVILLALVAVAYAAQQCHDKSDCTCHHANQVANCENHVCTCVATGGKRETHTCVSDPDCVAYDCHGHGTPSCIHHGGADHGHSLCGCVAP